MPPNNTMTWGANVGLPRGYVVDPRTGELVPGATQGAPTMGGTTDFNTLRSNAFVNPQSVSGPTSYQAGLVKPTTGTQRSVASPTQGGTVVGSMPRNSGDPFADWYAGTARGGASQIDNRFQSQVDPALSYADFMGQQGLQWDRFSLDERQRTNQAYTTEIDNIINQQRGMTAQTNANGQALVGRMGGINQGLNAFDFQNTLNYQNTLAGLMNSPQYSGAHQNIASNPGDVQRQLNSYNQLSGIAGGSLDYQAAQAQAVLAQAYMAEAARAQAAQSQAEQARVREYSSNPNDVARMEEGVDLARQLAVGNSTWNREMKEATAKFKGLSDPEITDKERAIMESFRQQNEGQMRSNREALQQDLSQRGIRSGASEMVGLGQFNQQTSQDRIMAELGAGATAVDRSMRALEGYGTMANAGRQAELQSRGLYIDAAGQLREANDRVGMFNTDQWNTQERFNVGETNTTNRHNAQMQTDVSRHNAQMETDVNMQNARNRTDVSMHNSSMQTNTNQFNAQQRNIASANNQATRLGGAQSAAMQSNSIRDANDSILRFNSEQSNIQNRHMDQVKMNELIRQQSVADSSYGAGRNFTTDVGGREERWTDMALGENSDADARNRSDSNAAGAAANNKAQLGLGFADALSRHGAMTAGTGHDQAGRALSGQNTFIGGVTAGDAMRRGAAEMQSAEGDKARAMELARIQAKGGKGAGQEIYEFFEDPLDLGIGFNPSSIYSKF